MNNDCNESEIIRDFVLWRNEQPDLYWHPPSESIPSWNKGVKDSSETKERKRLAKLGKKRGPYKPRKKGLSVATRNKMSESAKGRKRPDVAERNKLRKGTKYNK